jgi:hypothetical protein
MAHFNEILIGRWNRFLQKLLSMKGGPPAPQLASEIGPTFEMENPPVENRYLLGWDRYAILITGPANPGTNSGCRLRNPVGSNVVIVIEGIEINTSVGDTAIVIDHGATTLDNANVLAPAAFRLDARSRPRSTAVLSVTSAGNPGGLPNNIALVAVTNTQSRGFIADEHQEITVLPGDAIQVRSNAVNTALTSSFMWRERLLEESERT